MLNVKSKKNNFIINHRKGKTILYILESCHLEMGAMLHIVVLVQIFFMKLYVVHIYSGKVSGANNCYILNFFQKYIHCNTFHSCKLTCPYIYSLCVILSVSDSQSVQFEASLFLLFSLCGLLAHQFQCKHYDVTVVVLLLYKSSHCKSLESWLNW